MNTIHIRMMVLALITLLGLTNMARADGLVKGIYLTQSTVENADYLKYLVDHAKEVGISTFVADLEIPSKLYQKNIKILKDNHITYIARVVMFPNGGKPEQITSPAYWDKRYQLIKAAVAYGADQIQLDYIRYSSKQPASPENAKNIYKIIKWYKDKLAASNIPLQADVFGIASFGESRHIGQNLKMMAQSLDALCPMVYPSHFEPYKLHAVTPYETIFDSLKAIRAQFDDKMPVKLYAYIELFNYRYHLTPDQRRKYVLAEMKAARDAGADGWFVWSAHNYYDYLFKLLKEIGPGELKQDLSLKPLEADNEKVSTSMPALSEPAKPQATLINDASLKQPSSTMTVSSNEIVQPWPLSDRYFPY